MIVCGKPLGTLVELHLDQAEKSPLTLVCGQSLISC